jgi:hypothetical protein
MRLLPLLLVTVAACSGAGKDSVGVCDRRAIDQAFAGGAPADNISFNAAVVAEACTLPSPLEDALVEISQSGDCIGAARGIAEAPELFIAACPAGHASVRIFQENAPDVANGMFAERCELPRLGFASQDELAHAPHWACMILGSMVYVSLRDAKEPAARVLARRLALGRP